MNNSIIVELLTQIFSLVKAIKY